MSRNDMIPALPPQRRRVPLPLAIFFGAISVLGFLTLVAGIWLVLAIDNLNC